MSPVMLQSEDRFEGSHSLNFSFLWINQQPPKIGSFGLDMQTSIYQLSCRNLPWPCSGLSNYTIYRAKFQYWRWPPTGNIRRVGKHRSKRCIVLDTPLSPHLQTSKYSVLLTFELFNIEIYYNGEWTYLRCYHSPITETDKVQGWLKLIA